MKETSMPETNFRALCAELVRTSEQRSPTEFFELRHRARAALAQPDPVAPTNDELSKVLYQAICEFPPTNPDAVDLNADQYELELEIRKARAVLAHWGTPANNTRGTH